MFDQLYNSNYMFVQGKDTLAIWVEMVHDVRIVRIGGKHRTDGIRPFAGDSIGWWEGDTLVVESVGFHLYQWIVKDPTRYDREWGGEYEFAKSEPPYEYACHEGNYGLENILAGARAQDAMAAGRPMPDLAPVIR